LNLSSVLQYIPNFYKHFGGVADESHTQKLIGSIDKIEQVLQRHAGLAPEVTPFLGGVDGNPRAVDYLVWPWLERLGAMLVLNESE
jgi:hypothetical protein